MSKERLYNDDYITLFADGRMTVNDGVGYIGEVEDVERLYYALKVFFEKHGRKS